MFIRQVVESLLFYQDGYLVDKHYTMALEYYKKAASQNDAKAQNSIRLIYKNGYGVPKDINIAIEWYDRSGIRRGSIPS